MALASLHSHSPAHPRVAAPLAGTAATASTSSSSSFRARREQSHIFTSNYDKIIGKNAPSDTLLTFAYGANLSAETLRTRGVSPSASLIARAPGYKVVFQHRGGYASLEKKTDTEEGDAVDVDGEGDEVRERRRAGALEGAYGVVHRISRSELSLMKRWEIGYEMADVSVLIQDPASSSDAPNASANAHASGKDDKKNESRERRITATVFVSKPSARLRAQVPPFREYHERILDGARAAGLPPHYVGLLTELGERAVAKSQRGAEYFDVESWSVGRGGSPSSSSSRGGGEGEGSGGGGRRVGGSGGGARTAVGAFAAVVAAAIACFTFIVAR